MKNYRSYGPISRKYPKHLKDKLAYLDLNGMVTKVDAISKII